MPPTNPPPLGLDEFLALTSVSRETGERCAIHLALLAKWQAKINLVGPTTLRDPWRRHVLDSAQLMPLLPESTRTLVDLGSGAGFPGLVLAILGAPDVHLIESDHRKVAFLREVAAATGTKISIHCRRIDEVPPFSAQVVTARALAPLASLLPLALPFLGIGGICLFPKGEHAGHEIAEGKLSENQRVIQVDRIASRSDPGGVILRIAVSSA